MERTIEDALKVADVDDLQEVGRLAHERDPERYPYTHLTELTTANYVAGNPLYDILHDGRTVFDGSPLLSLKSIGVIATDGTAVKEWKVNMPALVQRVKYSPSYTGVLPGVESFVGTLPNLQYGWFMFAYHNFISWEVELPSLVDATYMFRDSKLAEWEVALPNLANGDGMFNLCRLLTSFLSPLPSLTDGTSMFNGCKLDLLSVQTIARTIKDNNSMATPPTMTLGIAKALQGRVDAELELIRQKGWNLAP